MAGPVHCVGFFCDAARTDGAGKLAVDGLFSELYAPAFPARQDHLVLVLLLEWPRETAGRIHFDVDLDDPEGEAVFSVNAHTDVDARPAARAPAKTHLLLPLNNVIFPRAGTYNCRISLPDAALDGPRLHLLQR